MLGTIERYRDRVIERAILPRTRWKPGELAGGPLAEDAPVNAARRRAEPAAARRATAAR